MSSSDYDFFGIAECSNLVFRTTSQLRVPLALQMRPLEIQIDLSNSRVPGDRGGVSRNELVALLSEDS